MFHVVGNCTNQDRNIYCTHNKAGAALLTAAIGQLRLGHLSKAAATWQLRVTQIGAGYASLPPDAAQLLSRSGALLCARRDMRTPFAAWLAQQCAAAARGAGGGAGGGETGDVPALDCLRRYEVSSVLRQVCQTDAHACCYNQICALRMSLSLCP
jgi:hypothetical protein